MFVGGKQYIKKEKTRLAENVLKKFGIIRNNDEFIQIPRQVVYVGTTQESCAGHYFPTRETCGFALLYQKKHRQPVRFGRLSRSTFISDRDVSETESKVTWR